MVHYKLVFTKNVYICDSRQELDIEQLIDYREIKYYINNNNFKVNHFQIKFQLCEYPNEVSKKVMFGYFGRFFRYM